MPAIKGRSVFIHRNGVLVAGARTKAIAINGSPIDITNDDDDGVRKIMEEPGQVDVTITVSGIVVNGTLRTEALSTSDRVKPTDFIFGTGSPTNRFRGDFFMSSYSESFEYQGVGTFEATFESAGDVVYS